MIEHADARRARLAVSAARATVPPNDRLQAALHPVSAFVVIPLFGLANAGVALDGATLRAALSSSVTLGVFTGLVDVTVRFTVATLESNAPSLA